MAKDLIIVDSCVFIKAFRKDKNALLDLTELTGRIAYSTVSYLELLTGANTKGKKDTIRDIFDTFYSIPINSAISSKAVDLMYDYTTGHQVISVPDCLIAATALVTGFQLYTYNKKDFDFIGGIDFYEPN